MNKFKFATIKVKESDIPLVGYYSNERVTTDSVHEANSLPEDIKADPHIYYIRRSDDGRRKATVEPKVFVNFGGSFVTSRDIFESMKDAEDKYFCIEKFQYEKQERV